MVKKIIYAYLLFIDWFYLFKSGCLKKHDFDYIVTSYRGNDMFFQRCRKCNYVEGFSQPQGEK